MKKQELGWVTAAKQHMCTGGCMEEIEKGDTCWGYYVDSQWLWRCTECQERLTKEETK